jgi:opacity protein-like surface antigen
MSRSRSIAAVSLAAGLAFASSAAAQSAVHFGLLGGTNRTSLSLSPSAPFGTSSRSVPSGGAFLSYDLSEPLSIEARVTWVQKSVKLASPVPGAADSGKISIDYVTIPVLVRARLSKLAVRPYVMAGAELAFKAGQAEASFELNGMQRDLPDFNEQVRSNDLALDVGAGVEIPAGHVSVLFEGLYSHGLRNINQAEDAAFREIKTRAFRLAAGVRF